MWNAKRKVQTPTKKHSCQDNLRRNSESIGRAILFQEEGEKRANLLGNTTPCSAGKECTLSQAELRACLAWKVTISQILGMRVEVGKGSLNWSSSSRFCQFSNERRIIYVMLEILVTSIFGSLEIHKSKLSFLSITTF